MIQATKGLLLCAVTVLFLSACSKTQTDGEKAVNVAYFPNITHSQALVGIASGEFQEALGDDVEIVWREFNAGPAEIEAIFAGEVDIGYIGPVPAINGYVKSQGDIKVIAGATDGGAILVSRKDLVISDLSALSGKKLAVPQYGNTQHLSLLNLLRENNLQTVDKGGTVEIVQTDNPEIKVLLDNGTIDAALVPEPWGARLVHEIEANIILNQNEVWRNGEYPTAVVIVRTEFMEQNPELVKNFLKAHVELTEYINANPEEAKQIIDDQIYASTGKRLAAEVLDDAFGRLAVVCRPSKEAFYDFIDIMQNEGFIKECKDKENLLDLSLIGEVMK